MSSHKFAGYPRCRASEYEWLGEIPAHWVLKPLKHLCSFAGGSTPAKENRRYWDGGTVPWVSPKDMKVFRLSKTQDQITEAAVAESSVSRVAPGALLMVVRSGILQRTIPVAINSVSVTLNQDMKALTFSGPKGAEYFAYLVQGHVSALLQRWTKEGATVESVEHEFLANDSVPDIPIDERRAIVAFLDYETAKIDALIEKQQQLIALLKEKRQAVISHAVTKGLNPDAAMRDSAVEWLGDVPAHWVVKRLKHISPRVGVGLVINPSTYTRDEGVYFVFGGDVKEYQFDLTNTRRISAEDSNRLTPSRLNSGDLLSVRVGDPGITAVVPPELEGANCASVIIVRRGDFDSSWLCSAMNSWVGRQQVGRVAYGAAQKQFNVSDAVEFVFPVPPREEQETIASFIADRLQRFEALSCSASAAVMVLQERRTALISAAVTGKIDVRGWKPPEPEAEAA